MQIVHAQTNFNNQDFIIGYHIFSVIIYIIMSICLFVHSIILDMFRILCVNFLILFIYMRYMLFVTLKYFISNDHTLNKDAIIENNVFFNIYKMITIKLADLYWNRNRFIQTKTIYKNALIKCIYVPIFLNYPIFSNDISSL